MVEYSLLPKVELHVHLDSSLSFEFVKKHKSLSQDEFNARFKANGTPVFNRISRIYKGTD